MKTRQDTPAASDWNLHRAHGEAERDALHHVEDDEEEGVAQVVPDAGGLRGEGGVG
jgi:hypothetical protein